MLLALYVRVSTDRQALQGASLPDQIVQMQAWAKQFGHTIVKVYEEPGLTATDDRRPVFQEMIVDATSSEHPFDAVVVHTLSRFVRDSYLLAFYELKLKKAKVQLISVTQPMGNDHSGEMMRKIIGMFDEYSSKETGKNVRRCMLANAKNGFFNGAKAIFGYKAIATDQKSRSGYKKRLEINKDEAEVVRLIFDLSARGREGKQFGTKRIAEFLNLSGMTNRGKRWCFQRVGSLLNNTIYIGELVYNKQDSRTKELRPKSEWVIIPVPPIVDKQTFELASKARTERQLSNHEGKAIQSPSLLTGLLKCSQCQKGLVLMSGKSGRYRYYRCITKKSSGVSLCNCPNVPKELLEAQVLKTVVDNVLNSERVLAILRKLKNNLIEASQPDKHKQEGYQREVASNQEKLVKLYEEIGGGKLEMTESLTEHIRGLDRKQEYLKSQIAALKSKHSIPLKQFGELQVRAFTKAMRDELLTPGSPYAKQYLCTIVSKIMVKQETAEISGNNLVLAAAISKWKLGTPLTGVPRIVTKWCAGRDSNS